jgi:hypothetical protein
MIVRSRKNSGVHRLSAAFILALLIVPPALSARAADIVSYAFVNDDGTLRVRGRTIQLYGIFVPSRDFTCRDRPSSCPRVRVTLGARRSSSR